ncbi:ATP-binding protein [Candidatus Parcubacteria bacterium]|nr:MAG: ATP-binding protein [Candidatus Parcubacteria bacterium]
MNKPIQYLLVGLPFSGKTTLANKLVKTLGLKSINIDEVKKEYGYEALDDDHVPKEVWKKIFNKIDEKVINYLKSNYSVVTETAWVKKAWRDKVRLTASREGFETKVIYVRLPAETARKRLMENRIFKKRFDVPDNIFDEAVKEFEEPKEDENVIIYDQSTPLNQWIKQNFSIT